MSSTVAVRQTGNSLAVTIPKRDRERKHWDASTKLEIVDHPEGLLLRPVRKRRTLAERLATVTPESMTPEIRLKPAGREVG